MNKSRCCVPAILLLTCLVLGGLWSWHVLPMLPVSPASTASVQQASEAPTLSIKRIEEVQLGERLLGQNPLRDEVDESFPEVDPATWRQLRLHITKRSAKSLFIELLRPGAWLKQTGAAVGGSVHLDVKEMGFAGEAKVLAIEPCPSIADGPGNVCTGRFIHEADGNLLDLTLADQAEVTTTTPTHPYWSQDRHDFIPAGKLLPGERLKTAFGETTVLSIAPSPKNEQVYNLEIHREHVYLVGSIGSLVHNAEGCAGCPTGLPSGTSGSVVANKLSKEEARFAQEIVQHRGGKFTGQTARNTPGVDGAIDGVSASLKTTVSTSPAAVLRHASKAESQAKAAGHTGVELFIEARNVSSNAVLDFARKGGLGQIPFQGTISRISVLTKDGWLVLPGL